MPSKNTFIPSVVFHPGLTLQEKLHEMGMCVKEFAVRTSKPEKTIHAVIGGDSSITSDMAVAFESVLQIPAHFWINKQRAYDEYIARTKREEIIVKSCEWGKHFPFSKMVEFGWISEQKSIEGKVNALFSYFQISTVQAWEDYFYNQQLKVVFRISLYNTKEPFAISAWLRQGEIKAGEMSALPFYENKLQEAIPEMKEIMIKASDNFAEELQSLCAGVGVKLIYTPCLPKAPISGSTRWISDVPCIQLTGRNKKYDSFWFTFFHEIGHILLHGKKDIFLEDIEYTDKVDKKEKEADQFAANILLSIDDEETILSRGALTFDDINRYAMRFHTHPAIIVGRLHHKKRLAFSVGNNLIPTVDLFPSAHK